MLIEFYHIVQTLVQMGQFSRIRLLPNMSLTPVSDFSSNQVLRNTFTPDSRTSVVLLDPGVKASAVSPLTRFSNLVIFSQRLHRKLVCPRLSLAVSFLSTVHAAWTAYLLLSS